MKTSIQHAADPAEFFTEERCFISELSNDHDDKNLSIARARVEPGVTTAWHLLKGVEERYLILSGRGLVEVGTLPPTEVNNGDVVRIPAEVRQRITNIGDSDLIFHALCTPRFTPECYVDLEKK